MNYRFLYTHQIPHLYSLQNRIIEYLKALENSIGSKQIEKILRVLRGYHSRTQEKLISNVPLSVESIPIAYKTYSEYAISQSEKDFPHSLKALKRDCFQTELELLDTVKVLMTQLPKDHELYQLLKDYEGAICEYMKKIYSLEFKLERVGSQSVKDKTVAPSASLRTQN
jgi:hypothetical protein